MNSLMLLSQGPGGSMLPTAGLVIAFILFVAIVAWVFLVPTDVWRRDAEIPLDNDLRRPEPAEKNHA